ncbi:YodL domain-containing protein [Lachnospiraceae bacterium HCP1S3_C2]
MLIQNDALTEFSLINVRGMDRQELIEVLSAMNEDDKLSIPAYLESKGAWTTELGNEQSEEVEEYHLDVRYNTDTDEIKDMKAEMELDKRAKEPIGADDVILKITHAEGFEVERITNKTSEEVQGIMAALTKLEDKNIKNIHDCLESCGADYIPIIVSGGRNAFMPQFNDFEIDLNEKEVVMMSHLSSIQQAEGMINRLEFGKTVFSDDERNLIVNYAYKLDDMDKTRELAEYIFYQEEYGNQDVALAIIDAQAEIDALPDGMIGLSEMHEYGYTWNEMLPLTKERAMELFDHDLPVYLLHEDGSEITVEDRKQIAEHEGIFGIEKGDWENERNLRSIQEELSENDANKEAQLLYGNTDKYGIYQLKDNPELRQFRFEGTESLKRMGITKGNFDAIKMENYNLIYVGELSELQGQTQEETLEAVYEKFNIDHPVDYKGHSLSVSDIVVLHQDGENTAHFVDSFGFTTLPEFLKEQTQALEAVQKEVQDTSGQDVNQSAQQNDLKSEQEETQDMENGDEIIDLGDEKEQVLAEMKLSLKGEKETELAFQIADRFISIQEVDSGYDYSIMGTDYKEIDGGVYDNPEVTIRQALHDIVDDLKSEPDHNGAKGNISKDDELVPIDYDGLMEKVEEANRIRQENTQSNVVADFKAKTGELFHDISEMNPEEIEETVKCHVQAKIDEYDIDATIVDVAITGSRCRGLEHDGSDLDVVVELSTAEREDDLFNAFNEDGLHIGEVKVDINPITAQRTGTLETYLPQVEEYLEGVRQLREQEKENAEVTLTVSECGEFHNLGECYENIPTVDEAIAIWKQIPSERMNGIPAIGINILGRGAEPFEDYEIDVLSGKRIDLGVLDYVPDIKNNPQAMEVITELVAKLPDMEIDGVMSEEMEARVWELRMPDLPQEEQLAVELDRLSYDYDTVLYHDSTRNMTENVSELAESIKQGDTGHLTTWLADIISEGAVPEEIKRATELLEKLTEYKPLAKIEEAEEQNYNMIDNVLNNGVGEKAQREENKRMEEKPTVRLSLKSRLAEKKSQVEGQSKEHDVQENEKKSQREM